ncbi:MAG: alpha/beta fold hydrolase, partial [Nocardioidaceae bacterium]
MADDLVTLADGRRMQFWRGGSATGPPVVFLPGTPDSRLAALSGAAAADRVGIDLIAVNRPGYGRSDPLASDHVSVADDVVGVAD